MNFKTPLAVALGGAVFLSACGTDPARLNDPTNPNRNTNKGALIGAGVGALVGNLAGGDTEATAAGAVIGGLAGGVIGNQLDKQEAELRQQLGSQVDIRNTGDRLIVTMPQDILFATDSATLRPDLQSDLVAVARSLNEYPQTTVQVIGHTDNTGAAAYNQQLSARRAQTVSGVLVSNGVSSGRIQSFGRGEDQPKATNLTPEGRQQNRRVEIVILPTQA